MMKTRYLLIIIFSFFLGGLSSCEKLIETEFPNNQLATKLVFEDKQTANAALAGLYGALWNSSLLAGGADGTGYLLGLYTDELVNVPVTASPNLDIYQNNVLPTNAKVNTAWSATYQQIYMANSILEGLRNSIGITEMDKTAMMGEALFVRSFLYFYLQQMFGDIPYTVTTDYQVNKQLSRTAGAEVLRNLERDIADAIEFLPTTYRTVERIHPNKQAARLLLAKIKVLMGKWTESETLCRTIIQDPSYIFQPNISQVFLKTGQHILWQLKPRNSGDVTKERELYYFLTTPNLVVLNKDLVNTFSTSDLRKQHWIIGVPSAQPTNYQAAKYKNAIGNTNEYSIVFRLEEVYLILAESLLQQEGSKHGEALTWINKTRERANIGILIMPLTKEQALSELLGERRREFFAEFGHRFLDLKRSGLLGQLTPVKPNWKNYHVVFPLPEKELLLNSKLLPQNTGY